MPHYLWSKGGRKMSVVVMELAWYVGGLTPAQKAVLVALADHADDNGNQVYPAVERICIKTSYAERTVRRALADLRNMGLIHVVKEATYHASTEYKLDLPQMHSMQHRPATNAPHDLPQMHPSEQTGVPENTEGVPESANRPARNAPKPSYNHQDQPSKGDPRAREPEPLPANPLPSPDELMGGKTRGEVARAKAQAKIPHTFPGIDPKLLTRLTNEVKRIRGMAQLIDKPGADATEDELRKLAFELWQAGYETPESLAELNTRWQEQARNYTNPYPHSKQLYQFAIQARNPTGNRNGDNRAAHRNGNSSTEWRRGNSPEPEPEHDIDEEFLAQVAEFNAIRRQHYAQTGH
jgi:hypothetical protein